MTVVAIERTPDQRLAALKRANEIRVYRSRLKRLLKAGAVDITAVLADPAPELRTMKVNDLLRAVPKYGTVKSRRILFNCRVSETKTIGGLSDRQRGELVGMLRP